MLERLSSGPFDSLRSLRAGLVAGLLLLSFPAGAIPSSSCGMTSFHPRTPGPTAAALQERAGFAPLPGTPNYFSGGCMRPTYSQFTDSATMPIRVHYDPQYAAMAAMVLGWAETSWDIETRSVASGGLEFPPPAGDGVTGGGSNRLDFYLEPSQYGGYYCPEYYVSGADFIGTSGFISINPDLQDDAFTSAAVAHELHHAIQLGLDAFEDPSFMEMTSAYVMEVVFDQADAASLFVPEFQAFPHYSLDYFDYGQPYQYGASMWLFWLLDDLYAADSADALRYLWLSTRQPYDGVNQTNEPDYFDVTAELLAASSLALDDVYAEFASDRWFTGGADDGTFAEGGDYPGPDIASSFNAGDLPSSEITLADDTSEFGASYVRINLSSPSADATLTLDWDLDSSVDWTIVALRADAANDRSIIGNTATGTEILRSFDGEDEIVIAFVNRGDGNHDPDADDWGGSNVRFSLDYDDPSAAGGGDDDQLPMGCGCSLAASREPSAFGVSALFALAGLALMLRRRVI